MLPGLSEFLSRLGIQANAASPLTLPDLEQQPTLLSVTQLVQAINLAGSLTQREPAFAEAHATAVGSLLQVLEQRIRDNEPWLPRHAISVLRYTNFVRCCTDTPNTCMVWVAGPHRQKHHTT